MKFYGPSNTPSKWFESYLYGRQQFVDFDGKASNTAMINTGVPQGSILGPLLFIIYMNDIHMISYKFNAILYADDSNLISLLCALTHHCQLKAVTLSICHTKSTLNLLIYKKFTIVHYYQRNIEHIVPEI